MLAFTVDTQRGARLELRKGNLAVTMQGRRLHKRALTEKAFSVNLTASMGSGLPPQPLAMLLFGLPTPCHCASATPTRRCDSGRGPIEEADHEEGPGQGARRGRLKGPGSARRACSRRAGRDLEVGRPRQGAGRPGGSSERLTPLVRGRGALFVERQRLPQGQAGPGAVRDARRPI